MWGYIWAELTHRSGRALGTLTGVALGVALYIGLTAVGAGFAEAARQPLAGIGADILISRPAGEGGAAAQTTRGVRQPFGQALLTLDEAYTLGGISGVGEVSSGLLLWDFGPNSYQTVLGVDAAGSATSAGSVQAAGPAQAHEWIVDGRFFQSDERDVVVVDRHYAAFFNLQPGATQEIGGRPFTVIGILEIPGGNQAAATNFYLPLADAQSLAGLSDNQINQIYLRVDEAADVETVVAESETRLGSISAITEQSIVQVMGSVAQVSDRFAGVIAAAALLGGLILTSAALSAGINLRSAEIGVMKATGWRARDVEHLFVIEGVILSGLGVALGIFLGWLAVLSLAQIPVDLTLAAGTTPDLGGGPEIAAYYLPARLSLDAVLIAAAIALGGGALASYLSAHRAARLKPADALRKK